MLVPTHTHTPTHTTGAPALYRTDSGQLRSGRWSTLMDAGITDTEKEGALGKAAPFPLCARSCFTPTTPE
ncbi:MAG: hypothetical protein IIY70_03625 [Oscillospiraceae bacterium]|nr:hypothetical protein [Oscillospiraceae bacterium]